MSVSLVHEKDIRIESQNVVRALTGEIASLIPMAIIEEIGSTAIPGSLTKGDIDLVVLVKKTEFSDAKRSLSAAYEWNEMEDIEYFSSYKGVRSGIEFGIQLSTNELQSFRFIEFRDILNANPDLVAQYNAIKQEAAEFTMDEYRIVKNEFIESVLVYYA